MKLEPVKSSNIDAVGYDPDESKLIVRFKGGGTYAYDSVPANIHQDMITSKSVGSYFHKNIRDKFKTTKLESL